MISEEEASIIAHEHIDGIILQEDCSVRMSTKSTYPKSWVFNIYHRNQDKDTFHTVIEVTNNGIVAQWDKTYILDENGE